MSKGVLVVEDDALLSVVQKRMIEGMGHHVLASVQTGREAINEVKENEPDIILMDISLDGDMDGIDTMKEIRKKSSVPVIYLSGHSDPEYYERAKTISPIGILKKPIRKYELESYFEKAFYETK